MNPPVDTARIGLISKTKLVGFRSANELLADIAAGRGDN